MKIKSCFNCGNRNRVRWDVVCSPCLKNERKNWIERIKETKMEANKYQELAARTINEDLTDEERKMHALHGMVGEIGELHSLYQKGYQGHEFGEIHEKKELSDLCWFIAEYCTARGWELSDVFELNIQKLMARYPEGFSAERSLNRKEGDV